MQLSDGEKAVIEIIERDAEKKADRILHMVESEYGARGLEILVRLAQARIASLRESDLQSR